MLFGSVKINTNEENIKEVLTRRIEAIFPSKEEAVKKLKEGRQLRVYLGIDPTGPSLHLGHTIPLLFLKQLLSLGHKPVLVIGDFTARIGDPSGKDTTRKQLTEREVQDNMKNYLGQIYKILPKGNFEVRYNSSWLSRMTLQDVIQLASNVTVQQMFAREMFRKRFSWKCPSCHEISHSFIQFASDEVYESTKMVGNTTVCPKCGEMVPYEKKDIFSEPIFLQEFLYPLMQGYDSVAMKIDGEAGGNDQTFNMLVGRDLEKKLLNKDKLVFATRLLVNAESGKKMSKTESGLIYLSDSAQDIYGKTMKTVPDEMIQTVFELCTEKSQEWIEDRRKSGPYEFKKDLAGELVRMYHGEEKAKKVRDEFDRIFSRGEDPEKIQEAENKGNIFQTMTTAGVASSNSEAKRLLEQGAVRVNDETVKEWGYQLKSGDIIKIGPRKFLKIK